MDMWNIITKPIQIEKNCYSLPLINKFASLTTACSPKQFNKFDDFIEKKSRNSEIICNYNNSCERRRCVDLDPKMPPEEMSPRRDIDNHHGDCGGSSNGGGGGSETKVSQEISPKNLNNETLLILQQQQQAVAAQSKKSKKRRRRNRKKKKTIAASCVITANDVDFRPKLKERTISTSSDDSFIVFENDDDDEGVGSMDGVDGCTPKTSSLSSPSSISDDDDNINCLISMARSTLPRKKVHFAADDDLCKVHPMIKWSFAYQAARKGPWEQCSRDRERFGKRIRNIETILNPILTEQHRSNMYQQRFTSPS